MSDKESRNVVDDHDTSSVEEEHDKATHERKRDHAGDSEPIERHEYGDNAKESKEDSDEPR